MMLSLAKYMKEDNNQVFMKGLNSLKKREFSVAKFSQNNIDTEKGLLIQRLHKEVIEKYKVQEAQTEMLSLKLKNFY